MTASRFLYVSAGTTGIDMRIWVDKSRRDRHAAYGACLLVPCSLSGACLRVSLVSLQGTPKVVPSTLDLSTGSPGWRITTPISLLHRPAQHRVTASGSTNLARPKL